MNTFNTEETWICIDRFVEPEIMEHKYSISSFGRMRDTFHAYEPSYHSTNGYDFTLMTCNDNKTMRLFAVDTLMAKAFKLVPDELIGKPIKIEHIDGDTRNNRLHNLRVVEYIEEWRILTYPSVKPNTYEVSNFGRIRRLSDGYIYHLTVDTRYGYVFSSFFDYEGKSHHQFIHRMVAWEYLTDSRDTDMDVNHINGIKTNNTVMNLEWVERKTNIRHAMLTGLNDISGENSKVSKFKEIDIRIICEKLVEFKGDIEAVMKYLSSIGRYDISRWNVEVVKYKRRWKKVSDEYFDEEAFNNVKKQRRGAPVLNEEKVRIICKCLLKNDMDVYKSYNDLISIVPEVTHSQIYKIKKKYNWRNIISEYF